MREREKEGDRGRQRERERVGVRAIPMLNYATRDITLVL